MSDGEKFLTCSKHRNKRIIKVCQDLDCQEILLCEWCEQQKQHKQTEDISLFTSLDSLHISHNVERLQIMRKKIIELNDKVSHQKNNVNQVIGECFSQLQKQFIEHIEACQESVSNGVAVFCERFRKIFSKLLQEISEESHNIKKRITNINEYLSTSSSNVTSDNYSLTQGLKNVQQTLLHKIPHLETICEDLERKQEVNLINSDNITNDFCNSQIDILQILDKLTLNAFLPKGIDNLSLDYELQPPKVNYNSIYADTITKIQLEQSIFAHLNPISSLIAINSSNIQYIKRQSTQNLPTLDYHTPIPQLISTGWDGTIKAWNLQQSLPVIEINTYNGGVSSASLIQKQNILACSHFNYSLELYDLDLNPQQTGQFISSDFKTNILQQNDEFSQSNSIISQKRQSEGQINKKKNRRIAHLEAHEKTIQCIIVKENSANRIICGCSSSAILSIPIEIFTCEGLDKLIAHTSSVQTLCDVISTNDQLFLSGSSDSLLFLWDLRIRKPANIMQNSNEIINSISQLSEYTFITASHDSYIKMWDLRMFKNLKTIFAHRDAVSKTASFYPKFQNKNVSQSSSLSDIFVSSGNDNIVNIWNLFDKQSLRFSMKGHSDVVWAMDIDIDSKRIYTGSRNEEIKVWSYT